MEVICPNTVKYGNVFAGVFFFALWTEPEIKLMLKILKKSFRLFPAGKIAEKAVWRSVFLNIWHCIWNMPIQHIIFIFLIVNIERPLFMRLNRIECVKLLLKLLLLLLSQSSFLFVMKFVFASHQFIAQQSKNLRNCYSYVP